MSAPSAGHVLVIGVDGVRFDLLGPDTAVLVTRGAQGMALFERGRPPVRVPAQAREVYDVTGAGDTVAGTLALTLAVGGSLEAACRARNPPRLLDGSA